MAGIFQVMAVGIRALDKKDVDPAFMAKLSKIATAEIISSKVLYLLTISYFVNFSVFKSL